MGERAGVRDDFNLCLIFKAKWHQANRGRAKPTYVGTKLTEEVRAR
jgi:hypothetical protein